MSKELARIEQEFGCEIDDIPAEELFDEREDKDIIEANRAFHNGEKPSTENSEELSSPKENESEAEEDDVCEADDSEENLSEHRNSQAELNVEAEEPQYAEECSYE
mmetsp:Transcript_13047/g.11149  ORF Transcript_13047/g.11149 Transcript_13047/m.11149 type:complete len:106 (-) Transcript_13047:341-658(-)